MLLRMALTTVDASSESAAETRRRSLLAESDVLLDDVETLRLQDETEAPPRLREAIHALHLRLGRRNPPAHDGSQPKSSTSHPARGEAERPAGHDSGHR